MANLIDILNLGKFSKYTYKAGTGTAAVTGSSNANSSTTEPSDSSLAETIKPGIDLSNAAQYTASIAAASNKIPTSPNYNKTIKGLGHGFQFANLAVQTPIFIDAIKHGNTDKIIETSLAEAAAIAGVASISPTAAPIATPANLLLTAATISFHYKKEIYSSVKESAISHASNQISNLIQASLPANATPEQVTTNHKHSALLKHPLVRAQIAENLEKHTSKIKPSYEEKANYTVQPNDTLTIIGKKTGHSWLEILALNKNTLKNNPDLIYPGQELLIPDNHAALINNPVVQARIREIMARQQVSGCSH